QVAVRSNDRVRWKGETDSGNKFPRAQVNRQRAAIIKLQVLILLIARNRVVHDLVNDYVAALNTRIGCAGSSFLEGSQLWTTIRIATKGDVICLRFIANSIKHAIICSVAQENRFPFGFEAKTELSFVKGDIAAGGKDCAGWHNKFIGSRVVTQNAAGDIERAGARVE